VFLLSLCTWLAGTATAQTQATACMPDGVDYCPVKIVNKSVAYAAEQFQVLAVAQKVDAACQGQTAPDLICPPAYVEFDALGVGRLVQAAAGMTSLPFARRLSDFPLEPGTSDTYVLKMPRHGSGRVYITLGESITSSVIGTAPPFSISDPQLGTVTDPSYYKIYDKFESSFLPYVKNDPQERNPLYINITSVDSLSLPLALELRGDPAPVKPGPVGYTKPRQTIFTAVESGLRDDVTDEWEKLIPALDGKVMRVIAPNKGLKKLAPDGNDPCTQWNAAPCFDRDYFKAHLQAVWSHYDHGTPANAANAITIYATEILTEEEREAGRTLKYTGFVTDSDCAIENTQPVQTPTCGDYLDRRNKGETAIRGAFCFKRDPADVVPHVPPQPESIPVALPSTDDMISGDGALCPPNKTARSIIARDFNALLNRGLLPIAGAITIDDGDKTPNGFWAMQKGNFYTNWPLDRKPNYNLYADVLHSLSTGGVYAFAFDDVGGEDSTLADDNASAAIVTIQDLTGTAIPNPTAPDSARYSGVIALPGPAAFPGQTVKYDGKVLNPGDPPGRFENASSPIKLVWVADGVEHPLAIHLGAKYISPPPLGNRQYGIVLDAPASGAGDWTIGFPGGSAAPSPWPSGNAPNLTLQAAKDRAIVMLTKGVVGNDYANLAADWYLWVKTADNTIYYCKVCDETTSDWVMVNSDDDVRPFRTAVRIPANGSPVPDAWILESRMASGANVFHFGVNTTTYFPRKDDGTLFEVSTTYQK